MKSVPIAVTVAAVLALAFAAPAEAAKKKPRSQAGYGAQAMTPGGSTADYQSGVMKGPLYNGQDYLGDDPDPNIRAYLLRDLNSRYGGAR